MAYFLVTKSKDGAVQQLDVENAFGASLQAGAAYDISPKMALFVDVKKLFVKTKASGAAAALGGAPVSADLKLDPVLIHAGIEFKF